MTIRHYDSRDAGAPVLSGLPIIRLKQILLACLVNGYAGKPSAGWTVGHQSADGKGFSLFNGDGYVNFVFSDDYNANIYVMDTITNGTTALAAGANRRSGAWGAGSTATTERHWLGLIGFVDGATDFHWSVVADDKTAYLVVGAYSTTADFVSNYSISICFGKYGNGLGLTGPASFCVMGGALGQGSESTMGFCQGYAVGTLLRNPFTGLAAQGLMPRASAFGQAYGRLPRASAQSELRPSRLYLNRVALGCAGAGLNGDSSGNIFSPAGFMRGLLTDGTLSSLLLSDVCRVLGLANTWQAVATPIVLPGGKTVLPVFMGLSDHGYFISLDPADWS